LAIKYFFDTHIAKAVSIQLREKGVDALRCEDVGLAEASDEKLLQYATDNNRVMVSQDEDFIKLHSAYQNEHKKHKGIFKFNRLQREAQISVIVTECLFYSEAEDAGAIDYETEIENTIIYF